MINTSKFLFLLSVKGDGCYIVMERKQMCSHIGKVTASEHVLM